jgi:hypothetical protein
MSAQFKNIYWFKNNLCARLRHGTLKENNISNFTVRWHGSDQYLGNLCQNHDVLQVSCLIFDKKDDTSDYNAWSCILTTIVDGTSFRSLAHISRCDTANWLVPEIFQP